MLPNLTNSNNLADILESYTAEKGVWATVDVGAGSHGVSPLAAMDSKGILWIMFGSYLINNDTKNLFNVWNYNPKTDQYHYVWGSIETSRTNPRDPGDLHVPAETNHPGAIRYAGVTIDRNDNIWFTSFKDGGELWMFNTTSMMFVRMHGFDLTTVFPSVGANPGKPGEDVWPGFMEGDCLVTDSNNDIWKLSGSNFNGVTSSVWHFNTTSLLWTFITGSIEELPAGNYNATFFGGVRTPGCFIDENDRVWLYGGWGTSANGHEDYGSIWTFDTRVKREWELEFGPERVSAPPKSVSADYHPDNQPGSGETMLFVDRMDGTAMLVATVGFNDAGTWGSLNQVWLYHKTLKQWKLVHGDTNTVDADVTTAFVNYRQPGSNYTQPILLILTASTLTAMSILWVVVTIKWIQILTASGSFPTTNALLPVPTNVQ